MDINARMEAEEVERDRKAKRWKLGEFVHDPDLPPATWTVDGVVQEGELDEEALRKAVYVRSGRTKAVVAVSAPLHLTLAEIIGWLPPYK